MLRVIALFDVLRYNYFQNFSSDTTGTIKTNLSTNVLQDIMHRTEVGILIGQNAWPLLLKIDVVVNRTCCIYISSTVSCGQSLIFLWSNLCVNLLRNVGVIAHFQLFSLFLILLFSKIFSSDTTRTVRTKHSMNVPDGILHRTNS